MLPDTLLVRTLDAAPAWQPEAWRISTQLVAAGLSVLGGYLAQKYRADRDDRKAERVTRRTEREIRKQVSLGISTVCDALRPTWEKIQGNQAVHSEEVAEITRRIRTFESVLPRVFKMGDEEYSTKVVLWFAHLQWVPHDLEVLVGKLSGYRDVPEPVPLDPELAKVHALREGPPETQGSAAKRRVAMVLGEGRSLGATLDFYDTGSEIVAVLSGDRPQKRHKKSEVQ